MFQTTKQYNNNNYSNNDSSKTMNPPLDHTQKDRSSNGDTQRCPDHPKSYGIIRNLRSIPKKYPILESVLHVVTT